MCRQLQVLYRHAYEYSSARVKNVTEPTSYSPDLLHYRAGIPYTKSPVAVLRVYDLVLIFQKNVAPYLF